MHKLLLTTLVMIESGLMKRIKGCCKYFRKVCRLQIFLDISFIFETKIYYIVYYFYFSSFQTLPYPLFAFFQINCFFINCYYMHICIQIFLYISCSLHIMLLACMFSGLFGTGQWYALHQGRAPLPIQVSTVVYSSFCRVGTCSTYTMAINSFNSLKPYMHLSLQHPFWASLRTAWLLASHLALSSSDTLQHKHVMNGSQERVSRQCLR